MTYCSFLLTAILSFAWVLYNDFFGSHLHSTQILFVTWIMFMLTCTMARLIVIHTVKLPK